MSSLKNFSLIISLSLVSSLSQANSLSVNNEKFWEKTIKVKQNSVIAKSQCNGHTQLSLDSKLVRSGDFTMNFSVQTSADDQYHIVSSSASCVAANKNDCLTADNLRFSPETSATLSCWKYEGMTIELGDDGNIIFDSDNPEEKALILKALAKKDVN